MGDSPALPRRVTSFDVAEAAGVSQSTVSRALSGSPVITQETRERIRAVAREMGYQVDARAAGLRSGRTGVIAVIVVGRAGQAAMDANPFQQSLLASVCAAASQRGYRSLVAFEDGPEGLALDHRASGTADGIVCIGTTQNEAAWDHIRTQLPRAAPVALWGTPFDDVPALRSDNGAGGRQAARALLDAGCERPAFVGNTGSAQRQFSEREAGFRDALAQAGVGPSPGIVPAGSSRIGQGQDAARQWLALTPGNRPDGLFFGCDAIALGTLPALAEAGVAVPGDVQAIGFDGVDAGQFTNPPLSSIRPDMAAAGTMLVEAALGGPASARVPVEPVWRGSLKSSQGEKP